MATGRINGIKLIGLASAVPEQIREIADDAKVFDDIDIEKTIETTGVRRRHATSNLCTSDLCFAAAEQLFKESGCKRDSIDALIFVSQTFDYPIPATSCTLQRRLKLEKSCAAFDVNLGCSGYVYGIWLASNLLASGSVNRVLLLAGDTSSIRISPQDRSAALLFGDGGSATILEKGESTSPMAFVFGTDGTGQNNLIVPAGEYRHPSTEETRTRTERESGNIRCDEELYMNGAEIFAFSLREVPPMIRAVLKEAQWDTDMVDAIVMHQANKFILQHLAKRMKFPKEKAIIAMENYGNTSSASIPLAMTDSLAGRLQKEELRLILAGFGVGYSWGALAMTCGPMVMPELVLVPESAAMAETEEKK